MNLPGPHVKKQKKMTPARARPRALGPWTGAPGPWAQGHQDGRRGALGPGPMGPAPWPLGPDGPWADGPFIWRSLGPLFPWYPLYAYFLSGVQNRHCHICIYIYIYIYIYIKIPRSPSAVERAAVDYRYSSLNPAGASPRAKKFTKQPTNNLL